MSVGILTVNILLYPKLYQTNQVFAAFATDTVLYPRIIRQKSAIT